MRPRLFKKENYVSFNKETNKSTCLICRKELCGFIIGNIKRHYETMHNIKFTRDYFQKATVNINTITRDKEGKVLTLSKNEFVKCCVGLIAVRNLPLGIFDDDSYFKRIIAPYEEEYKLNLGSANILDALEFWALRVRTQLRGKFYKKLVSLQVDIVGRQGKKLLGLHAQYIDTYQLVVHTIGMVPLKTRPSTQMLKEAIVKCLQELDIDTAQVYSITCDGRSLKAIELIQDELEDIRNVDVMEVDDGPETEKQLKPLLSALFCGSYTIELAAKVYFKTIESDLNECRAMIKEIRQAEMENAFLPTLDSAARWRSTFDMVSSLKNFTTNTEIDCEAEYKLEWFTAFLETYQPLVDWAQHQESKNYLVGDFYRDWLVCEAKLKQMADNEYAMHLLEAILELKQKLLDNEAFNAALYFDPRFNHLDSPFFSEERKKLAVDHILRLKTLMHTLDTERTLHSDDYDLQNDTKQYGYVNDPYNILEAEIPVISRNSSTEEQQLNLRQKLENLAYTPRLPYSSNVLEYWKLLQVKDPEIHVLMKVILAVPISKASIERTISGLSTLLTKDKAQSGREALNNMLLVKANTDILTKVEA